VCVMDTMTSDYWSGIEKVSRSNMVDCIIAVPFFHACEQSYFFLLDPQARREDRFAVLTPACGIG
jgi:hypothetical protein